MIPGYCRIYIFFKITRLGRETCTNGNKVGDIEEKSNQPENHPRGESKSRRRGCAKKNFMPEILRQTDSYLRDKIQNLSPLTKILCIPFVASKHDTSSARDKILEKLWPKNSFRLIKRSINYPDT